MGRQRVECSREELLKGLKELSILYVEDDPLVRKSTHIFLSMYFDKIDIAHEGKEGLQLYCSYHNTHHRYYDIILTDLQMPRMNGIELIHEIRRINERQNIIVITAHNETDYLLKLIELEISHIIIKPLEIERFEKVFCKVYDIIRQKKELKILHNRLEKAKIIAEEASRQKSRFLANMSHEIRTPLNAITGFITLLEEMETDTTKQRYLKVIHNASDSLLEIINDILDLSKIENGAINIEPVNFDPYVELVTTAELFKTKAVVEEKHFDLDYDHNIPSVLFADILRIKQIYINLLSNALKFTPSGGYIHSSIWYRDAQLYIVVEDNGIGISVEKQEIIFSPFTQADNSTTRHYGGTGLGLSISYELTKLMNGRLEVKSREGKGSIFTLTVPVQKGTVAHMEQLNRTSNITLYGHILIVEDHEANRLLLGVILENAGLTWETASNGLEALKKFKKGSFDLILMDENMPKMGGQETLKSLLTIESSKQLKHTPVIALTANALHGDRDIFLNAGFDDYLSKPIDPQKLISLLALYLKKRG